MMAAQNPPNSFMHFKRKTHTTDPLVLNSLSTTVTFAMPAAAEALELSSRSAPSSPVKNEKKRKGFLKHLTRPKSPTSPRSHPNSDPERSPSPNPRPKWLVFKNHKRKKSKDSKDANGGLATPVGDGSHDDLSRTLEPVATPVYDLPGQTPPLLKSASGSNIPVITVSHSGSGEVNLSGSLDDVSKQRKLSQTSHCSSNFPSTGTSGVGSLLSPSGDEGYDLESPISPLSSRTSSFTEHTLGDLSDMELISPVGSDPETITSLQGSSPPPQDEGSSPTDSNHRAMSPGKGALGKFKRDKKSSEFWFNLKKAVKAWSPFAVQFKKKCYPWVQLAGHKGNFMPGDEAGTIMKKSDPNERKALQELMNDTLKPFVPEFKKVIEKDGHMYVEMTDLLREFEEPAVMDIKVGLRTYLEEELRKKALRADMYNKMVKVDPHEPTESEHAQKAITKPRYMQWRESLSSSSTLGFRIEGIKTSDGTALTEFKETKAEEDVVKALRLFLEENPAVKGPFLRRLLEIRAGLERSEYFRSHELIGSSLLFVYDSTSMCSVHMIDFGKTVGLPDGVSVSHREPWVDGNHEDGYLLGLDNLIRCWEHL